ncbi:hypothetical protein C5167_011637 [Papaver somniferum]|uniref:Methyltransferase domain-containing protein n=1 Tax=Papaver somniferum TaxID=3469 RepID=A0A4Y7K7M7_PAPSO|nr:hypothetical protein C5167_011637 [Papaver somniferum]
MSSPQGVLIPRPEIEKIVELVQEVVAKDKDLRECLWVDLGADSGALVIAIGKVLGTQGKVIAMDLSLIAASVTQFSLTRYDLQVINHEPRFALDGGENVMDDLLHLCEGAACMLRSGGPFCFRGSTGILHHAQFMLCDYVPLLKYETSVHLWRIVGQSRQFSLWCNLYLSNVISEFYIDAVK